MRTKQQAFVNLIRYVTLLLQSAKYTSNMAAVTIIHRMTLLSAVYSTDL